MSSSATKTIFTCSRCGGQSLKWAGRCGECGGWGTLNEERRTENREKSWEIGQPGKVVGLEEIEISTEARLQTGINEVDRVLGGGLSAGAVILLAGEPGIGKSTLVAQIANSFPRNDGKVLYVSGEESPSQIKERFLRLSQSNNLIAQSLNRSIAFLPNTNAETIVATTVHLRPTLVIVDSAQTLTSNDSEDRGAVTKLQASVALLAEAAKKFSIPLLLIGQVTKNLDIAGPKSLEHLVDVVLSFEGDRSGAYRLLRAQKNRFGPTDEIGVFTMTEAGLREVANPSAEFLGVRSQAPGSVATSILEGTRPLLIEIQALASKTHFPYPERRAAGFDTNRLNLLLAVLEETTRLRGRSPARSSLARDDHDYRSIAFSDIHLNVTSGFKIREPAADLAVILAVASSLTEKPLPQNLLAFGEVGLGGELRPVRESTKRIQEARKMQFITFLAPPDPSLKPFDELHVCANIHEALEFVGLV
ncbi:DNA repair protein RadA [Candidatus Uhrbacteria bacterium]|nr:DNA repair protein RadA [Candidatus Uhrbacteria bacterium]